MKEKKDEKFNADRKMQYNLWNISGGCNYSMREFLSQYPNCSNDRYLLKPLMSEHYKIMIDTKYGNEDYPVRIYVYDRGKDRK